ncbi:MipA/OmpV family protein [Aestuariivirga sp.]|uniref:MipA/OmpV family protein n=1 Tax=Aestuariivirga sp. TaxID=2650926 RepID=UPI003918AECF
MTPLKITLSAAALLLAFSFPATADEMPDEQYVLDLGVGVMAKPRYPGSDEVIAVPFPIISVGRFFVPGIGQVIDGDERVKRFSLYPSFNFNGRRDSSDSNELEGLDDVDWALEVGLGAAYRHDWIRGFIEVRQGFNGYSGQVADFGLDFIANPTEDLQLMAGPRAGWGSDDYMDTYFGISGKEAADSPVYDKSYDAGAGFHSVGLAATASYDLTEEFTFHLRGGWDRLIGEAADSPIVKEGSANQFYGGAGLSYEFGFSLD